ncbi:MAG: S1 family peptidase [Oscillospiraceae bacterium]|jgi:hypothetical protein|nr:S1 family peptidase [Oscillospiraceae bacterium]
MKRKYLSRTSFIFLFIFLFTLLTPSLAIDDNKVKYDINFEEPTILNEIMKLQKNALEAYEKFWQSLEKDKLGLPIYPVDYAGEYIQGDTLIILVKEGSLKNDQINYKKLFDSSQNVTFKEVKYSLKDLEEYESYVEKLSKKYTVVSYGIDRKNNVFLINLLSSDYEIINSGYNETLSSIATNNLPIVIGKQDDIQAGIDLYGGDKISSVSLGIGGTYGSKNAILTCGHTLPEGTKIYRGTVEIGKVVKQRFAKSTSLTSIETLGDFGIVEITNSSYSPTNKVRDATSTVAITGYYSSLPVGTAVYKYGSTTGYSYGTVTAVNLTILTSDGYSSYNVRGITSCSMRNSSGTTPGDGGDSGGPFYINDGAYKISGTYSSHGSYSGVYRTLYFSPIYYAIDAGFTPKTN